MSHSLTRPLLGAALNLESLRNHREWIIERQRDLEIQDFVWADLLTGDWQSRADAIKHELDGYQGRLGIHGPFWGLALDNQDPEIRAVVTRRLVQGLDVAASLGATQMVIHSPYTTWDYNNFDSDVGARDAMIERVHACLKSVVTRAESEGIVLVIENIEDIDPHARVILAKSFASHSVRVSIDTGHANYAFGSTGAPPVDYFIYAAGDMLNHIHLQDTDGYADRHWAPGEGNIAWASIFHALKSCNSNPRLILELRDHNKVRAGADHLVRLGLAE
jgi:sugar phosphate isomerase/epimerase